MNLIILAIIIIAVVMMLIWAVNEIAMPSPGDRIIKGLIIAAGALILLSKSGLL